MFAPVWRRVVEGDYARRLARLAGYGRRAVRGESYPAIVPVPGEAVDGVLYLDVADVDLARLDHFEGDDYARETVRVEAAGDGSPVEAGVYVWRDASRLDAGGWDPQDFERERMAGFIAGYCAARAPGSLLED